MLKDDKERFDKIIQEATLFDDWFMQLVMKENVPCMTLFLAVCLNDCQICLSELHIQDPFASEKPSGRNAIFDVWARDDQGNTYNLEVQNAPDGATPLRAFHNLSLMAQYEQKKGEKYAIRQKCYVIFITRTDHLGNNLPRQYLCGYKPDGQDAGIGAYIVYINGQWTGDDPIGKLVHDMKEPDPDKMYYEAIANRVRELKQSKGEGTMSPTVLAWRQEAYDDGYNSGVNDGYNSGVNDGEKKNQASVTKNLLNKGCDLNFIQDVTGLSEEEVLSIQKSMTKLSDEE